MKRDSTISKWLENSFDVNFLAASDADMQVWNMPLHKILQKAKEYRSWGWKPRDVGTLVDSVDDDVNWLFCGDKEHLVKTLRQDGNAGLLGSLLVFQVKTRKYLGTMI